MEGYLRPQAKIASQNQNKATYSNFWFASLAEREPNADVMRVLRTHTRALSPSLAFSQRWQACDYRRF